MIAKFYRVSGKQLSRARRNLFEQLARKNLPMTYSRHLVDSELMALLDAFPTVDITADNLEALREAGRTPFPFQFGTAAPEVSYTRQEIPGPDGAPNILLHMYRANCTSPLACIFHIHGGGYVGGSVSAIEKLHRQMAGVLGCALISVDYRLAPETAFPGNVEDCYAGLTWVFEHSASLGINPNKIGVMGESAGGGLSAALALLARDRGRHKLAFQQLIYPMLDDRTCVAEPPHPFTGEFIWNSHNNHFGWSALLGTQPGSIGISSYAAPARAESLAGLPPTFISTGALDLFLEEDIEYARRLARAGVPVELHVYPGAFHGFDLHPSAKVAEAARRASLDALARFTQS